MSRGVRRSVGGPSSGTRGVVDEIDEAVRKDDGAVAVKVLRIVVRSITWSSSKLVLEALAYFPKALTEAQVDGNNELVALLDAQLSEQISMVDDLVDGLVYCVRLLS